MTPLGITRKAAASTGIFTAIVLVLMIGLALVAGTGQALADEPKDEGTDVVEPIGEADSEDEGNVLFSVPSTIAFTVKADGTLRSPSDAKIVNEDVADIHVTAVKVTPKGDFEFVENIAYATGSNAVQMTLGVEGDLMSAANLVEKTPTGGDEDTWKIAVGESLTLKFGGMKARSSKNLTTATPFGEIEWFVRADKTPIMATFDANGGTGSMDPLLLGDGVKAPECGFIAPPGKRFTGSWNTEADGTGTEYAVGAALPSDASIMLYAQWEDAGPANWAVYSADDNSLTFLYSAAEPTTETFGKTVTATYPAEGGWGEKTYGYGGTPWFSVRTSITSVEVIDVIKPKSTACWFYGMTNLTSCDLEKLDTSNVTSMSNMFYNCSSLTSLDVSSFDTSNVTSMSYMFSGCPKLTTLDVSNFNTANVTNMAWTFRNCTSLSSLDVSGFDTSNVKNMSWMFGSTTLTSLDLSNFDTSNVTDMQGMFNNCSSLTSLDVSSFDTSNVTEMNYIFTNCKSLTSLDVSSFDTSNVTNMGTMFYNCSSLTSLDVSSFDTSNMKEMSSMFEGCTSLTSLDVSHFNTSNVTRMAGMFNNCSSLTSLDLSSFNTSNVTDMSRMFCSSYKLTTIYVDSGFVTTAVTSSEYMFYACAKLIGGAGTTHDWKNITHAYAHIDGGTSNPGYFTQKAAASPSSTTKLMSALPAKMVEADSSPNWTFDLMLDEGQAAAQPAADIDVVGDDGSAATDAGDGDEGPEADSGDGDGADGAGADGGEGVDEAVAVSSDEAVSVQYANRLDEASGGQDVEASGNIVAWHLVRASDGGWRLVWVELDGGVLDDSNGRLALDPSWDGEGRVKAFNAANENFEVDDARVLASGDVSWAPGELGSLDEVDDEVAAVVRDVVDGELASGTGVVAVCAGTRVVPAEAAAAVTAVAGQLTLPRLQPWECQ